MNYVVALPITVLVGILAFLVGGGLAILITWLITRGSYTLRLGQIESQIIEVRRQWEERTTELAATRQQLTEEQQARITAQTRLEEAQANIIEQKRLLDEASQTLQRTFEALAAQALRENSTSFLREAGQTLVPLSEILKRYEARVDEIEKHRLEAYGALWNQAQNLSAVHEKLQNQVGVLALSLRAPAGGGKWGQMTLRRVVELAGMAHYCDFEEQVSVDEGRLRPDLVIRLPNQRTIVVDAKAPVGAHADAMTAATDAERLTALKRHAQNVRNHIGQLSAKAYWEALGNAPEFVVLFMPAESFFSAAVEVDRALVEDGIQKRVILATPTTLTALLMAVAYGWRQEQLTENARAISLLGKDLYERVVKFLDHFQKVGKELSGASKAYNDAIGSIELRVLPSVRKFKELGATSAADLDELKPVEIAIRELPAA